MFMNANDFYELNEYVKCSKIKLINVKKNKIFIQNTYHAINLQGKTDKLL